MEIREGKEAPEKEISEGNIMFQGGEKEGHKVMLKEERGRKEVENERRGGWMMEKRKEVRKRRYEG